MTPAATDRVEILGLYERYNSTIDAGNAEGWAATWIADGAFTRPNGVLKGHAELAEFVRARTAGATDRGVRDEFHWNRDITLTADGDTVRGACSLMISGVTLEEGNSVVMVEGAYDDVVVRDDGGWKFSTRALKVH